MNFKEWVKITTGIFLISVGVYFFLVPSEVIFGSVSGLSFVISQVVPVPMSIIAFILNMALLVIGYIVIGKEFGSKTIYTSMLLPVFLWIFEQIFPVQGSITNNNIYDLVLYILIVALGQAMLFNVNASSGGLDVVAKIINKYTHMEIGKACTIAGFITAASAIIVYDFGTMVVSLLGTYLNGLVVDYFIEGFNKKKRVCIVSDDYKQIQDYIMNTMHRGVTLYPCVGGYDQVEKMELLTIVTKYEYKQLLHYLNSHDLQAFVTVSTVNEVVGYWNDAKAQKKVAN